MLKRDAILVHSTIWCKEEQSPRPVLKFLVLGRQNSFHLQESQKEKDFPSCSLQNWNSCPPNKARWENATGHINKMLARLLLNILSLLSILVTWVTHFYYYFFLPSKILFVGTHTGGGTVLVFEPVEGNDLWTHPLSTEITKSGVAFLLSVLL